MNADGTNLTPIQSGPINGNPSWAPDGSRIAYGFPDGSTQIYTIKPDGSDVQTVTSSVTLDPDWSPDSTKIAITDFSQAPFGIASINRDGTGRMQISPDGGSDPS